MILIIVGAMAGLLTGLLIAAAWTAGCRQGRNDLLAAARALGRPTRDPPPTTAIAPEDWR